MNKTNFGYLRETQESAIKAGKDPSNGMCRTGLECYLKAIFPDVDDWIHDKPIKLKGRLYRPDYRSESLKLIVEFDGLPHYQKPDVIITDEIKTNFYKENGYKVVRIPYFIQLTNSVVKKLFDRETDVDLFPEGVPSFSVKNKNTPAYMCTLGIERCARELLLFEEQLATNENILAEEDDILSGYSLLIKAITNLKL